MPACRMEDKREQTAALKMLVFVLIPPLRAQNYECEPLRGLSNARFVVTAPITQTARYTAVGGGIVYGTGYNFSKHHSVVAEVMWSSLPPTDATDPCSWQSRDTDG